MITRRDVQTASDSARDRILSTINSFHMEDISMIKQATGQTDLTCRRVAAMEVQLGYIRQEIRSLIQSVNSLSESHTQQLSLMRNNNAAPATRGAEIHGMNGANPTPSAY